MCEAICFSGDTMDLSGADAENKQFSRHVIIYDLNFRADSMTHVGCIESDAKIMS